MISAARFKKSHDNQVGTRYNIISRAHGETYYVPVVTVVECAFTFPNGWIAGEFCYLVWMIYCTQRPNRYNWKPSLLQQVSRTCQHHNCNIYSLTTRIIFKGDWFQASRVGKNCKQAPQGWPNTGFAGSPACHVPHLLSMISYRHKRLKMSVSPETSSPANTRR